MRHIRSNVIGKQVVSICKVTSSERRPPPLVDSLHMTSCMAKYLPPEYPVKRRRRREQLGQWYKLIGRQFVSARAPSINVRTCAERDGDRPARAAPSISDEVRGPSCTMSTWLAAAFLGDSPTRRLAERPLTPWSAGRRHEVLVDLPPAN